MISTEKKIEYKIDVLAALKEKGYTSTRIRNEKLFGQGTLKKLRYGKPLSFDIIAKICTLLDCDLGDVLELKEENEE